MDISLDAATVTDLLRREVPECTPLDAWPVTPPADVAPSTTEVVERIASQLRDGAGFVVARWPSDDLDDEEVCMVGWNLFTLLCSPVPQYRTGELIYPVEVDPKAAEVSHYSGSNRVGGYHTDGTLLPKPPEIACLFGLSAGEGGETLMMDGLRLHDLLADENPAHIAALSQPVHFDVQGQIEGLVTKLQPVFRRAAGDFELRYLRRYIESGYTVAAVPLPAELASAMDRLDVLSADDRNQTPVLVDRGTALFWDNRRVLHGRREFQETNSRRRLRRIYGRFTPGRVLTAGRG